MIPASRAFGPLRRSSLSQVHWTCSRAIARRSSPLELVVEARDKKYAQEIRDRLAVQGFR